jgi:hypothetical protein
MGVLDDVALSRLLGSGGSVEPLIYVGVETVGWCERLGVEIDQRVTDHAPFWAVSIRRALLTGQTCRDAVRICAERPEHRIPIVTLLESADPRSHPTIGDVRDLVQAYLDSIGAQP